VTDTDALIDGLINFEGSDYLGNGDFHVLHRAADALATQSDEIARLRAALINMLSGWRYIRTNHGDLYGVGWERAEVAARAALAPVDPAKAQPASD
jgi:hypothetical protein